MAVFEAQKGRAVRFMLSINRLADVVGVLERTFYRCRGVATKASAALWADDGRESFRLNRRKGGNNDIFDPVRMVTRTAVILVPVARAGEGFVGGWFQRILVHRATPQTIRTL